MTRRKKRTEPHKPETRKTFDNQKTNSGPGAAISIEEWAKEGKEYAARRDQCQWKIGDWMVRGEGRFNQRAYDEAEKATGYTRGTLYQMKYVAEHALVRTEKLSWEHHRVLISCGFKTEHEQRRWLDRAVRDKLSSRGLAEAIRKASRDETPDSLPSLSVRLIFQKSQEHMLFDLRALALNRYGRDSDECENKLVSTIVVEYLSQPSLAPTLEIAREKLRIAEAPVDRVAAKVQRENELRKSIEGYMAFLEASGNGPVLPSDFVSGWEEHTGNTFTKTVFRFAIKHTALSTWYGSNVNSQDFGLPFDPPLRLKYRDPYAKRLNRLQGRVETTLSNAPEPPAPETPQEATRNQYNVFLNRATKILFDLKTQGGYQGANIIMNNYLLSGTGKEKLKQLTAAEWESKLAELETAPSLTAALEILKGKSKKHTELAPPYAEVDSPDPNLKIAEEMLRW